MKWSDLPKFAKDKLVALRTKSKLSKDEILSQLESILNTNYLQEDEQFKDKHDRIQYAIKVLWARLLHGPRTKEYTIIPVGNSGIRITKSSNKRQSQIFAIAKGGSGSAELRRIVLRGSKAPEYKDVELFYAYKAELGEFSGGDLVATSKTRFNHPRPLDSSRREILDMIDIPETDIAHAAQNTSDRNESGFTIRTDWRKIPGAIILRKRIGERDNGTKYAVASIVDVSTDEKGEITKSGDKRYPGFTVWCPPNQLKKFTTESECDFYGTISLKKDTGEPFMNCYLILPVHVKK